MPEKCGAGRTGMRAHTRVCRSEFTGRTRQPLCRTSAFPATSSGQQDEPKWSPLPYRVCFGWNVLKQERAVSPVTRPWPP